VLTKMVDGEEVEVSAAEEAGLLAEWAENDPDIRVAIPDADPVEKLRQFLAENRDVAALVGLTKGEAP